MLTSPIELSGLYTCWQKRMHAQAIANMRVIDENGRHRTKDVALWRQGQICIVVNSEREGLAHSFQISHGISVMLPISDNYYDDLEARTDLSSDQFDVLKALNILYDQDAGSVFYQAYTSTLDGGFFFEIVQRDGYSGYGAANASIRLSSQARLARSLTMSAK